MILSPPASTPCPPADPDARLSAPSIFDIDRGHAGLPRHLVCTDTDRQSRIVDLSPWQMAELTKLIRSVVCRSPFTVDYSRPVTLMRAGGSARLGPAEEPGAPRTTILVYVLGSTGMKNLAQAMGLTAYKIGVTCRSGLYQRVKDLKEQRYGGWLALEGSRPGEGLRLDGAEEWFLTPIGRYLSRTDLPDGIRLADEVLEVDLPACINPERFDKGLADLLAHRDLNLQLMAAYPTPELKALGFTGRELMHTDYHLTVPRRRSRTTEIYQFSPHRETDMLVALVDRLRRELAAVS